MSSLTTIAVPGAPKAIGPYAQGIVANGFLFTAGQVPLNPDTMTLVEGDIAAQTERVLDNLAAVLAAGGASFAKVVKTTIYLVDLGDFQVVNATYAKRFTSAPPARATVQVAALPKGARVEIDAIAYLG